MSSFRDCVSHPNGILVTRSFSRDLLVPSLRKNCLGEMWSGPEEGSYLRLIDSCIIQLNAHGPSRTLNESEKEDLLEDVAEEKLLRRNVKRFRRGLVLKGHRPLYHSTLGSRVIKKKKKTCSRTWLRRRCMIIRNLISVHKRSLIRNRSTLGPYRRTEPRVLGGS